MSNKERLSHALAVYRDGLAPFIIGCIKRAQNDKQNDEQVWIRCILPNVMNSRNKPRSGSLEQLTRSLDLTDCLGLLLNSYWDSIFRNIPSVRFSAALFRSKGQLIRDYRNMLSHPSGETPVDISPQDLDVALNTIESVLTTIGSSLAEKITEMRRDLHPPTSITPKQISCVPARRTITRSLSCLNTKAVYDTLQKIPAGRVLSYADVDDIITGRRTGAQAVSEILRRNSDWPLCHRVVRTKGYLSPGFSRGGAEGQRKELEAEGVKFDVLGRVLSEFFWDWEKNSN